MPTREEILTNAKKLGACQPNDFEWWELSDVQKAVDVCRQYALDHDKTPLTVEHLRQNNFEANSDWEFILRRPQRRIWVSASGSVSSWDWMIDFLILPCYLKPTTLGDLRQLISKIEGGAG